MTSRTGPVDGQSSRFEVVIATLHDGQSTRWRARTHLYFSQRRDAYCVGMTLVSGQDVEDIAAGYDPDPARSMSLRTAAYLDPIWLEVEQQAVFGRTWQCTCHAEKLRTPGSYVAATVAAMPIAVVRNRSGQLRAFYNVCKHRAHELLSGSGTTGTIVCPYHAWVYDLDGALLNARRTDRMPGFDKGQICLDRIQVEEFLECHHCHIAHREFVALVDMATYEVRTHGIWSSHFAEAGKQTNEAYDVSGASVTQHAVWWLWPNTCLLRYPGRGNFMIFQVVPVGVDRTLETWDFYFETDLLSDAEDEAVRYIDEVLQQQDIAIVESVQRGMATPAFDQGRIVVDPAGSGLSEHGVHHFHGLVLRAYEDFVAADVTPFHQETRVGR